MVWGNGARCEGGEQRPINCMMGVVVRIGDELLTQLHDKGNLV